MVLEAVMLRPVTYIYLLHGDVQVQAPAERDADAALVGPGQRSMDSSSAPCRQEPCAAAEAKCRTVC